MFDDTLPEEQLGLSGLEHRAGTWLSLSSIADVYGVSEQTVRDWIADSIIDEPLNRRLNLFHVVRKVYEHQRNLITGGEGSARGRLLDMKSQIVELELRKRRGELIEVADVKRAAFETARSARDRLQNIPSRVAGLLAAERDEHKVREILKGEIHQALIDLSRNKYAPEESGHGEQEMTDDKGRGGFENG